jgi:hypothetical protein
LTRLTEDGMTTKSLVTAKPIIAAITMPIAVMMWAIAVILFFGLPQYYRQAPGKVPSFYMSLFRRKIIMVSWSWRYNYEVPFRSQLWGASLSGFAVSNGL